MADQIAIKIDETVVSEGSSVSAQVAFRTRSSSTASVPSSVRYRVDCLTTKRAVVEWTSASAASSATITIPGTSNGIINDGNNFEERQLTVEIDTNLSTQARAAKTWKVRNIRTYDGLFEWPPGLPNLEPYFPVTNAETLAGVTPTNYGYEPGDVRRYGAVGDGSTDDGAANIAAILAALNVVLEQGGGKVVFGPGEVYNLGSFGSGSQALFDVSGLENAVIDFNGGGLTLTVTSDTASVNVFYLTNPVNVAFIKPRLSCSGLSEPLPTTGPSAINLLTSGSSSDADVGQVLIDQPRFEGFTSTLRCIPASFTSAERRLTNIQLRNGFIKNCYYGPNFQHVGDGFEGDWECHNIRRAYFPYGVRKHRVRVKVHNTDADYTANSCITISTQPRSDGSAQYIPTSDIHVHASFHGALTYWQTGSIVTFYQVWEDANQTIKDCSAFVDLSESDDLDVTEIFGFRSYNEVAGVATEETTTTDNVWRNITIDALTSEARKSSTTDGLLALKVSPNTLSSINLGPNIRWLAAILDTANQANLKVSGWRFYRSNNEYFQVKVGDLTAAAMSIDLSELDSRPYTLKLKIWAKSLLNLSGQDVTYREIMVTGRNAGGGANAISQQDTLFTHSTGTASAFTVGASGETLTVAFTNYSDAAAKAVVAVEHIWPFTATQA